MGQITNERKEMQGLKVQTEALVQQESALTEQIKDLMAEQKRLRERIKECNKRAEEYVASCVNKCFYCFDKDDDLIWIYNDEERGLIELRANRERREIRMRRFGEKEIASFIGSGFVERNGDHDKEFFRNLFDKTVEAIKKEAGLED